MSKFLSNKKELELLTKGYDRIIGIDEVGRGCWAGPVYVCGFVYSPTTRYYKGVHDSKKLTVKDREKMFSKLYNNDHHLAIGGLEEINNLGIGKVVTNLINSIVEKYQSISTLFLIDGKFAKDFGINTRKIIKGDYNYYSIAAASIIAKVSRDKFMVGLSEEYQKYQFRINKGYGTKKHRELLASLGPSDFHRTSFKPIYESMKLRFGI